MSLPSVAGTCPACGSKGTLVVGTGGYITCTSDHCPDPRVVADLLDRPLAHFVDFGEFGWAIQHAVTCFPDLLDCPQHARFSAWMNTLAGPPVPLGRYQLNEDLTLTAVAS